MSNLITVHEQNKLLVNVRSVNFDRIFKLMDRTIFSFFFKLVISVLLQIFITAHSFPPKSASEQVYLFHQLLVSYACTQIVSILTADASFIKNKQKTTINMDFFCTPTLL